jgi:hypothetical protein
MLAGRIVPPIYCTFRRKTTFAFEKEFLSFPAT